MSTLYLDIETEWMKHEDPLPIFVIGGYAYDDGPVQFVMDRERCRRLLDEHVGRISMHRGAFEAGTLECRDGLEFYDTAMAATIMGQKHSAALKLLGKQAGYDHTGKKGKAGEQGSFKVGQQFTQAQLDYLRQDVECTRAVTKWQDKHWPVIPDLERQTRWSRDVFTMGRRGLHIDQERLNALLAEGQKQEAQLRQALKDVGIIQPRGPKKDPWRKSAVDEATVQALLKAAGVTDLTEGTQLEEDEEDQLLVSDRITLVRSGDPRLKLLADFKTKGKQNGLVKAYQTAGGVVRARYNSLVSTGRMSCSAPNVQQVPKRGGLRECWVPSPGNVFVEGDYAMLELYTFSDTCYRWGIHSRLRDLLNEGQDVHSYVASNPAIATRELAKDFNYGGLGGMGAETMQESIEKKRGVLVPIEQIQRAQQAWKEMLPEIAEYWAYNTRIAHPAGFKRNKWGVMKMTYKYKVTNPQSGRWRLAPYCAAQNFGFQGPGGDIIKLAEEKAHKAGLHPVALLHDQLLCDEVASSRLEASVTLGRIMREAAMEICPNVRWPEVDVHIFEERWKSK